MEATIDSVGRIVLPKQLRDRLGLVPGGKVDISLYGDGLHIAPTGRTARIEQHDGQWVAVSDTPITDEDIFDLVDSIRR
jgi:AbrB family looped-hinge helix DNA binding protein